MVSVLCHSRVSGIQPTERPQCKPVSAMRSLIASRRPCLEPLSRGRQAEDRPSISAFTCARLSETVTTASQLSQHAPFTDRSSSPASWSRSKRTACVHTKRKALPMQKFLGILAVSVLLSAASASVVLGGPETLSATPFTFGPSPMDQFSLSYPVSGFFNDTFVSTTGTAEVSSVWVSKRGLH